MGVYASDAQRRFFHSQGAVSSGITPAEVKKRDRASQGKALPEKVKKKRSGMQGQGR